MITPLIRRILTGTAALAVGLTVAGAGIAQAAPMDSYQLTSSKYSITVDPFKYPSFTGSCGDGYHVRGTWTAPDDYGNPWYFTPTVQVSGKWIYLDRAEPAGDPIGTVRPNETYQSLRVKLANHSWVSKHDGSFTWTCDAN